MGAPGSAGAAMKPFVGQDAVVEFFRRTGESNLAHAYLFWGPRGVGKRTFATWLAARLHCENPGDFPLGMCGRCGPCLRSLAGSSGDTVVVDEEFIREADRLAGKAVERKTDVIGIEASRRIITLMQMHSYEGGRLVCIVPNFDYATGDPAYNALLKELEEPSPGKLFLLTAERPDRIPATIRSRTIAVPFVPLTDELIARTLREHYGVEAKRADAVARRAQGSLGDALAALEGEGGSLFEAVREWVAGCLREPRRIPRTPALPGDDPRRETAEALRFARLVVRDALAVALGGSAHVLDPESLRIYEGVVAAMGSDVPQRLIHASRAVAEAARLADETNIPPAQILGWLQVNLRSV